MTNGGFPASLPAARTPDPMTAPALRWGILGPGWIATRWATSVRTHTSQHVLAIGSRSVERARRFAADLAIPRSYGTYEDLVADPDVDAVYVATPHNAHRHCAVMALQAGKHVLVEKPVAVNAAEASEIAAVAQENTRFCMEAMWTLFLPKFDVIDQLLEGGVLGDVHSVIADYGEAFPTEHRVMRPDLAGGPLLDLGTYLIVLASHVLGSWEHVLAVGHTARSGVNAQTGILVKVGNSQAVLHTTLLSNTPSAATIAGTGATLTIDGPFNMPGGFTLTGTDDNTTLRYEEPRVRHDSLHFQVAEAARRIAAGDLESPTRRLQDSVETMRVLDEVRSQLR